MTFPPLHRLSIFPTLKIRNEPGQAKLITTVASCHVLETFLGKKAAEALTFSAESDPAEEARDLPGDVGLPSSRETHQHDAEVGQDGRGTVGYCIIEEEGQRYDRNALEEQMLLYFLKQGLDRKGCS